MSGSTTVPLNLDVNVTPQVGEQGSAQSPMVSPADIRNTYKPMMKKGGVVKGMAKGGKAHSDVAMDRKLIREEVKKATKKVGMKAGGAVKASASRRGDGCATRGKTKGRMI
jgi:hypothetical protein